MDVFGGLARGIRSGKLFTSERQRETRECAGARPKDGALDVAKSGNRVLMAVDGIGQSIHEPKKLATWNGRFHIISGAEQIGWSVIMAAGAVQSHINSIVGSRLNVSLL